MQDLREGYYPNVAAFPETELVDNKPELTPLSEDIQEDEMNKEEGNAPDTDVTDPDDLYPKERLGLATPHNI